MKKRKQTANLCLEQKLKISLLPSSVSLTSFNRVYRLQITVK